MSIAHSGEIGMKDQVNSVLQELLSSLCHAIQEGNVDKIETLSKAYLRLKTCNN